MSRYRYFRAPAIAVPALALMFGVLATSAPAAEGSAPVYGKPASACKLVHAATLRHYLPGVSQQPPLKLPSLPGEQTSYCAWSSLSGLVLTVTVTVFKDAPPGVSAQEQYKFDVKSDEQTTSQNGLRTKAEGSSSVRGLGTQATAVFQVQTGNGMTTPDIDLNAWSGNALISINIAYLGSVPSRTGQLASAVAVGHDLLAGLPRA